MPRRRTLRRTRPAPVQLPLFAEAAFLVRARPERGEWRFYRIEVWPDLFGRAQLICHWGGIGSRIGRRSSPFPDPGAAINALAHTLRSKRRRGYRELAWDTPDQPHFGTTRTVATLAQTFARCP
jgi:predicted DNA-binding WGR domain protein